MAWLSSLPGWLIVLASVALFAGAALAVRWLIERTSRDHPRENHHVVAGQLMPGLCAIFGIIAGLTLVGQVDNWNRAQDAVAREASAAARLAWATAEVPAREAHAPLRQFLQTDLGPGWELTLDDPLPESLKGSIQRLETGVRGAASAPGTSTQAGAEMLASLDDLTTARRERVTAQSTHLPTLFVFALVLAGLAVVVNAAAMTVGRPNTGRLIVLLVAVVAVDIALVIALWEPFSGAIPVSDRPLTDVVAQLRDGFFVLR